VAADRERSKLSTHFKVFLYAAVFAMIAYGVVHLGMMVQRAVQG
jgi:hypothetical protein